ncbi:MAG: 3-methyl-2-oxobutanoate hydroxymethyltransferase [Planctomycetota bacterium]
MPRTGGELAANQLQTNGKPGRGLMNEIRANRMTIPKFVAQKAKGNRLAVLTCYDYPVARIFDAAGVDALLVGDTVGTVVQGHPTTLGVTMEQAIYHTELVSRAVERALVVADMPFLSYQVDIPDSIRNAGRLVKEGGAHAVKLEGGRRCEATIHAIVEAQIPVMGHIGLTPQSIHKIGRYRVQREERDLLLDAEAVERAGAFAIVLESMPTKLAAAVTKAVSIPTIGIGAGPGCDGQVLVWQDAFGLTNDFKAKFVKHYADLHSIFSEGARRYCDEVRAGTFPDAEHSYE